MTERNEELLRDFESARETYEAFERVYRMLKPEDLAYLREHSVRYKKAVMALQEIILPAVRAICPTCSSETCCRPCRPQFNRKAAITVGYFSLNDHLLVRCDADLPVPDFENIKKGLCQFFDRGCRLSPESRSLICLKAFCEPLRRALDMESVKRRVAELEAVLDGFAVKRLLRKNP